jgi:hypothetical protein
MADISPRARARRNDRLRAVLLLALLVLVLFAAALLVYLRPHSTGQRIGVGDVLTLAKDKRVLTATIRDEDALVVGELRSGRGVVPNGGRFSAELPANGELTASLTALLAATGAHVDVDHQSGKDHARLLLTTLLPVLALTDLVALVLLTSPYADALPPHSRRGRHDLPAPVQPEGALDLPAEVSAADLPAAPADVRPGDARPVKRTAVRKAPARKRTPAKTMPSAPAGVQPDDAPPVKRSGPARNAPSAAPARKSPARKAAPAKASRAEDVLPVPKPTRRRSQP